MGNLTLANIVFDKNTASENGGALEVEALATYNVKYFANISNSNFTQNSAKYGGAIMGLDNTITNCIFSENSAEVWGGAILFNDTISTVTNSIKNDTESRSWINPVVVNDTNIKSWVIVAIDGDEKVLPGNYNMTVKFVLNDNSDLKSSMPIYNVKVANKDSTNKISPNALKIVDNKALLNYDAIKTVNDVISISNVYNSITSISINVYTKKETSISLENKTYDVTSQSKVIEAILKDSDGNTLANMPVMFHFDDKNYTVFTNERGIATINVSTAKVGIFNVCAEFNGDEDYEASNNASTVDVKL